MIAQAPPPAMLCFPPAALNGGPLDAAPPKVGEHAWEPKVDDWRAVIHAPSRTVWNQYGKLSSITDKFGPALDWLQRLHSEEAQYEWLDVGMMENRNDLMRGCIIVFDLIVAGQPWAMRHRRLSAMLMTLPMDMANHLERRKQVRDEVYLINHFRRDPLEVYAYLQEQNRRIGHKFYEGLVAKRIDSLYPFGRKAKQPTPNWIKHRFDQ